VLANRLWLCLFIASAVLAGCQRQPASSPETTTGAEDGATRARATGHAMDPSRTRPLQPGAAGTVEMVIDAFRNARLELIYDALPASYQQDVTQLVHDLPDQVDPELWDAALQVLRKAVHVLEEKRDIFIALLTRPGSASPAEITTAWGEVAIACDLVVRGILADPEAWKTLDVREALRKDISRVLRRVMALSALANPVDKNPLLELDLVEVDLVETAGTTARVRITPRGASGVEPTKFVQIDGKWIPQSLAESWPETMRTARDTLRQWRSVSEAERRSRQEQLQVIDRVLDQMLMARNVDQLAAAATPIVLQVTQWSAPITTPPAKLPEGPLEGVSILIQRELTDEELTRLLRVLESMTDDPEQEYHLATANGGKTFISIKPVADLTAFAAKLTFADEPTVDATARTITLRNIRVP